MEIRESRKWIIVISFTTAFLDMVNHALLVPIIPFLCDEMKADATERSLTFTVYSVTQLISLLIMGPMSDKYGRRPFLVLSLVGSCFGSLFQAMSPDINAFILWRGVTGLFAGSLIIVQAVVADLIPSEERNKYLARLDGFMNAAYIVGPALGGALAKVNNRFPLFICAIVAGIALIIAWIGLGESNPQVLNRNKSPTMLLDTPQASKAKVPIDPMLISLLVYEFCVRWLVNAFDSTYGSWMMEDYGINESQYSTYFVIQSIAITIEQFTIYPYLSSNLNIPIPYLSCAGQLLQIIFYILTAAVKNPYGSMAMSVLLFMSYCLSTPGPISILSTTSKREVQGTVISWLNICNQSAMIVSPIVAAEIYKITKPGVLYYSSILSVVAFLIMLVISLRPDAWKLGKVDTTGDNDREKSLLNTANDFEMKKV